MLEQLTLCDKYQQNIIKKQGFSKIYHTTHYLAQTNTSPSGDRQSFHKLQH